MGNKIEIGYSIEITSRKRKWDDDDDDSEPEVIHYKSEWKYPSSGKKVQKCYKCTSSEGKSSKRSKVCKKPTKTVTKPKANKKPRLVKDKSKGKKQPPDTEEEQECPICYRDYEDIKEKSFLPCAHHFHKHCVDQWLENHDSCPLCKTSVKTLTCG